MDYQQALQRFSYHASITDAEGEGWSSFAEALLDARAKSQFPPSGDNGRPYRPSRNGESPRRRTTAVGIPRHR
jgi:hypothetical protein